MQGESSSTESQLSQQKIKFGKVILKSNLPKNIQAAFNNAQIKTNLQKSNWRIKKKSHSQEWTHLLKWIQECHSERIMIESQNQSILKQLSMCKFTNLKVLNLSHNLIQSIEPLTFMEAPHLQFIFLETNHISNIKSISKFYYQNLQQVDLSGNKLSNANQIGRLKINKNKSTFSIELFSFTKSHHHHHALDQENHCKIQDISILAKLQHHLIDLHLGNNKKSKYEMLKRQIQYLFLESNSNLKLTTSVPQYKSLRSLSKKFYW